MKNWKRITAAFGTAALLLTNVGTMPIVANADGISIGSTETMIKTEDESVAVKGVLPEGAAVTAGSTSVEVEGQEILVAYDITVKYTEDDEEKVYEPADGESVSITITDDELEDAETVNIYHFVNGAGSDPEQIEDVTRDGNSVTFSTSSLSPFAATTPEEEEQTDAFDRITLSTDSIKQDGTITATFYKDGEDVTKEVLAKSDLSYTWTRTDDVEVSEDAVSKNKVNVYNDGGAGKTYSLTVNGVKADKAVTVPYNTEFVNNGFENNPSQIPGAYKIVGINAIDGWNTTAPKEDIEISRYATSNSAHGVYNDKYDDSVGTFFAELNATSRATLYQDVLTDGSTGDATLTWSLLHRARTNETSATDTMFAVIMSTEDAERLLASNTGNKQKAVDDLINKTVEQYGTDNVTNATYSFKNAEGEADSVKVTFWKLTTKTTRNGTTEFSGEALATSGTTKDGTGWVRYSDTYQIPEGQYLTRFFLASSTGDASGNLIDEIYFDQKVDYTIEYWVYNAESKAYELKDSESARVNPGNPVYAGKTGNYPSESYKLVGTTKGSAVGTASSPASTSKTTSFKPSSSTNVLSLYYKAVNDNEINVEGTITWNGDDDVKDTARPKTVTVEICDEDGTVVDTVTATADDDDDNNWTYSSKDLPRYKEDGKTEIQYKVTTTVDKYRVDVDGTDITCTYNRVGGKVTWIDNDDADKVRPEQVTVDVYDKNGDKVGTATVTEDKDGNWVYNIDDLPLVDGSGDPIEYTYKVNVEGYTTSVDKDGNVTCTRTTTAAGTLTWVGDEDVKMLTRPEEVTVTLTDPDGKTYTTTMKENADGEWVYSIDVPKYDADGNEIKYKVSTTVANYETSVDDKGNITCTYKQGKDSWIMLDPPVKKVVEGDAPSQKGTFIFTMVPEQEGYPVPTLDGKTDHSTITLQGAGEDEFGYLKFTEEGTYKYTVTEKAVGETGYSYDSTSYVVTYTITKDANGTLNGTRTILKNGKGDSLDTCTFTNTYTEPGSGDDGHHRHHKDDTPVVATTTNTLVESGNTGTSVALTLVDDKTGAPIGGATFELYNEKGVLVGTYTTNEAGVLLVSGLEPGNYYFRQIGAADGYEVNGWDKMFTVAADGSAAVVSVTNHQTGVGTESGAGIGTESGAGVGGATGDNSLMTVYGATAAVTAVLLAAWYVMRRRQAGNR